jgi:hypothetical protein
MLSMPHHVVSAILMENPHNQRANGEGHQYLTDAPLIKTQTTVTQKQTDNRPHMQQQQHNGQGQV